MDKKVPNNILVVDDDPGLLESTSLLLIHEGYAVTSCSSAHEALTKIQENNIDVVLSDIKMPEVSGIELLKKIHKINAGLPVILMTAYAELDTAVDAVKAGVFDFLIKPAPPEYLLHSIQKAFQNVNLLKLKENYKLYLEDMVAERTKNLAAEINERIRKEESLRLSEKRLRELSSRLQKVEETERKKIAGELHDKCGQNLTALSINLNIIQTQLPAGVVEKIGSRLTDSLALVEEIAKLVRNVMDDLRPDVLDDYGLVPALRWYGAQFGKRTGISVSVQGDDPPLRLPEEIESALFRISQEALTNVAKHSEAKEVVLTIEKTENLVCLTIKDDGRGFDLLSSPMAGERHGWGMLIMQERAQAVGGQLHVESGPEKSTRIIVEVKVEEDKIPVSNRNDRQRKGGNLTIMSHRKDNRK
jgi:signal transduction histidine kinase